MQPTWTRRLPCFTSAPTMGRQPAAVVASGFSQNTGFPAAMEASTNSSWVGPHEVTTTTSTSGAAITSRPVERARAPVPPPAPRAPPVAALPVGGGPGRAAAPADPLVDPARVLDADSARSDDADLVCHG